MTNVLVQTAGDKVEIVFWDAFDIKDTLKERGYRYGEYLLPERRNLVKGWAKRVTENELDVEAEWINGEGYEVEVWE